MSPITGSRPIAELLGSDARREDQFSLGAWFLVGQPCSCAWPHTLVSTGRLSWPQWVGCGGGYWGECDQNPLYIHVKLKSVYTKDK